MLFATKNSEKTSRGPVAKPRSNRRRPSRGTTYYYLRRAIFAISGPLQMYRSLWKCSNARRQKAQRSESFIKIKWNFRRFFSDSLTKNIFRVRTQWSFVSTAEKSIFCEIPKRTFLRFGKTCKRSDFFTDTPLRALSFYEVRKAVLTHVLQINLNLDLYDTIFFLYIDNVRHSDSTRTESRCTKHTLLAILLSYE